MKAVYRAHDATLDLDVALAFFKTESMPAEDMARIDREVKAMVALGGHHSIMRIADFGEHKGRRFIVTPLMSGGDLAGRISDTGPLELDELLVLAKAMAGALAFAHSKGVLHRDIKPENVWFDSDDRPYLGDFGLAVALDESRITTDGTVLGTPAYLAPECASGGLEAGPGSDLYSLGVLLYEAAVGYPPFLGSTAEVVSQHMSVEPVAPKVHRPDLPGDVEAVILDLLAKSPERRPASASALGEAIDELIAARSGRSTSEAPVGARRERFIGRSDELSRARDAVDSAAAGRPTFLTVAGDPGIGKTRLAEEAISYAELRGFTTAIGRCLQDEGAPAFWPWQQSLRSLVEKCDANEIREAIGVNGPVMARILPEVGTVIPGVAPALAPADPGQARFQLFDVIAAFLRRLSSIRPLLVLLEDIHWADESSLKLLQFIASGADRERQLIIGTYRDVELGRHHPLSGAIAELAKSDRAVRISLSGLEHEEIVEMVRVLGGGEASDGLVGEIESRTEGNPFFIAEVIRLAGESADGSWEFTVPQGVREVLGHRLNQLDEDTNKILALAAVIGREFQLSLLENAAGGMAGDVLDAIVEAEDAGLVAESAGQVYAFSHALVRETLYEELSTARRAMLHRKVAVAIEALYKERLEVHLAELAHHLLKSSAPEAAARATEFLIEAGRYSLSVFAYEDAVKNFETALDAIELAGIEGGEEECRVLTLLGDALWRQREGDAAKKYLHRALEIARRLGRWDDFARALLLIPGRTAGFGFVLDAIDELVIEAIGNLGKDDVVLRSRLLSLRVSTMAQVEGDVRGVCAERAGYAEEGLQLADQTGDDIARLEARAVCAIHLASPDRTSERKAWADGIIDISTEAGDWDGVIQGLMIRIATHYELAEIAEARSGIDSMDSIVSSDKPLARRWMLNIIRGLDAQLTGRLSEAEECAGANMRLSKASDPHEGLKTIAIVALTNVLLAAQGRQKEIAILYAAGARGYKPSLLLRGPVAPLIDIYAQVGEFEKAREWLDALRGQDYFIESDHQWLSNMTYLASAVAKLGDKDAATTVYERLSPYGDRFAVVGSGVACLGSTHRSLGQLAATLGESDLARSHFERGIDANRAAGARPYEAHCHRELADVLKSTGSGTQQEITEQIDEAVRIYGECGMDFWKEEARR